MWYSITGLILDCFGVLLLFIYGIPPKKLFDSLIRDESISDKTVNRNHVMSRIGLGLLIAGFGLQIIGTVITSR